MADDDYPFPGYLDPKVCIRCGATVRVLHSISPDFRRNSCGDCQGKANREALAKNRH